jgi:hypothetical protein
MPDQSTDARNQLLQALLSKVAEDTYPSTTMMDAIEEMLTPETFEDYVQILIGHVENDQYPSIPMIARLRDLLT